MSYTQSLLEMEVKDLAGISEPLKRLFELLAEGVGSVVRPYLIKKTAEAKAYEMRVISQALADSRKLLGGVEYEDGKIKILPSSETSNPTPSLPERAASRTEYQELRKQQNIEAVCANAAEILVSKSEISEERPEPEWINQFFDIAGKISTEDLRYWWGKLLAGEITKPGSFSLRTLDTLKNLSRQEAEAFEKLGKYILIDEDIAFFPEQTRHQFKQDDTLNLTNILALQEAGLIASSTLNLSINPSNSDGTFEFIYSSLIIFFEGRSNTHYVDASVWALTKAGRELLKLVTVQPYMEYVEFVAQIFKHDGMKVAWAPIVKNDDESVQIGDKAYITIDPTS